MATSSEFEDDMQSLTAAPDKMSSASTSRARPARARKSKRVDSKIDKNTRERKRRKNIKARFDKLHELMVNKSYVVPDPMHIPPSKVSVLNNAISTLAKMTKEIEHLRQENAELEAAIPMQKK